MAQISGSVTAHFWPSLVPSRTHLENATVSYRPSDRSADGWSSSWRTSLTVSGAQFGFRRSVPLMAGIAVGLALLAAAAAAGLAGLLLAAPSLQTAMQLAVLLGSAFGLAAAVSLSLWCLAGLLRTERQWRVTMNRIGRRSSTGPVTACIGLVLPFGREQEAVAMVKLALQ